MDFDFMEIIFFLVWGFFLFKAVFGGKRRGPIPPLPEEPKEPLPKEKPLPTEERSEDEVPATATSYDYAKLRKKILTSWGNDTVEKKQETAAATPAAEKEKTLHPVSISAKIEKPIEPALKKVQVSSAIRKEEKRMKAMVHREHHHSKAELAAFSTISEKSDRDSKRKWTQEDAKKWLVYDAIFGPSRSKRPWGTEQRSCR